MAAALLISVTGSAQAADYYDYEHPDTNAQKVLATLEIFGVNNKDVREFVTRHTPDIDPYGGVNLYEEKMAGGKVALRFDRTSLYPNNKKFELRYTPDDSHFSISTRTNGIRVQYDLHFNEDFRLSTSP